jgi:pSer/pThr/pTyr-binding forkhead associated (FHA) protein
MLSPYRLAITSRGSKEAVDVLEGLTVIGRGADCSLILDHPLVSRRHAALQVDGARAQLRDLGSRNGVLVNGRPLVGATELGAGDRFRIGDTDFELIIVSRERPSSQRSELRRAQTLTMQTVYVDLDEQRAESDSTATTGRPVPSSMPARDEDATAQAHFLELVGPVADKALALGRTEEAVRLIATHLAQLAEAAALGHRAPRNVAALAADLSTRLAEATLDPRWIAIPLQIYLAERRPLPLTAIDRLFVVMRRVPGVHRALLDEYVRMLQARKDALSPAERFALQRLESLARVAAL